MGSSAAGATTSGTEGEKEGEVCLVVVFPLCVVVWGSPDHGIAANAYVCVYMP